VADDGRDMARTLGFEGHIAWAVAMPRRRASWEGRPHCLETDEIRGSQNDELTRAEWIDAARKAAFAERTPASPHQVKALAACIPDRFVSTTRSACGFRFVR
jgi:hypothetical protein